MTSSVNATNHVGNTTIGLVKKCRKAFKEGVGHAIMHYSCKVGSNIGTLKISFKAKGKKR